MARVIISPILLLYSPFGLLLVLVRSLLLIYVFLASVVLYSVPPVKRLVLRLMCSILGYFVTYEGEYEGKPDQPLVSNCVTLFDHMGLNLLVNCVTPYKMMMSWALSWRHLNCDESASKSGISEIFHLQPEETPIGPHTNFMLNFNESPFRLFNKVQPVAISVRTFLPINLSEYPIDWKSEIFWLLFSPCIQMHVKFLEPINRQVSANIESVKESDYEFSNRVRKIIAYNTGRSASRYKKEDFYLMVGENHPEVPVKENDQEDNKKTQIEVSKKSLTNKISEDLDSRAKQVLGVLPNVPIAKILTELNKVNNDVDLVIAKLLEEDEEGETFTNSLNSDSEPKKDDLVSPASYVLASSTFSRSPSERHKSFEERKNLFIENARRRYVRLHPSISTR